MRRRWPLNSPATSNVPRSPLAGATILLNAAGEGAPAKLAQGKTDANGAFKLSFGPVPKGSVLYLVAKGGTPKVAEAKGPNDAIALLAVLGSSPPKKVTVNEFTTIASVWTSAQFLKGDVLSGKSLGLNISSGNVPNFVDLETGGYGGAIQDALNSAQTPTMANFATLANVLAGCMTQVTPDACHPILCGGDGPGRQYPDGHADGLGDDRSKSVARAGEGF